MVGINIYSKATSDSFTYFEQNINSHIPNIISSLTFGIYFFSFYLRGCLKRKDMFIESFNKEFDQPYNKK